jgi:hypothetical protein
MNTQILDQYQITFNLLSQDGTKRVVVESKIIPVLGEFFWYNSVSEIDDMVAEMMKAINNQSFDAIWGSVAEDEFHIGHSTTVFKYYSGNYPDYSVPTADLKEIFISYRDWLVRNNYQGYVVGM